MDIESVLRAFRRKGYVASFLETKEKATAYLNASITGVSVGFGDSMTLEALGLHKALAPHVTAVFDPGTAGDRGRFEALALEALRADVFLTSVNAASETGEMVNIDGTGNRVAGSLYGHDRVFFVFGINKIEPTLERAIWRARNVAAPLNAKRKAKRTPCAFSSDGCRDCFSVDRICNVLTIYERKMNYVVAEVVIIGESLGL